jgi:hypothetical protein
MRRQILLQMALWIIPLVLQPIIAVTMVSRKQVREFPVFFWYTFFVVARDIGLLALRRMTHLYAWIYWLGEPITIICGVAATYEVLWRLIRPYPMLRLLGFRVFWMSIGIAALTGLVILKVSRFPHIGISIESVLLLERSARFVQVMVLVGFMAFMSRFGLTWKHYASGIIVGFGAAAGLQLALLEVKSLDMITNDIYGFLKPAAYNIAVIVWAIYFIPRHPPQSVTTELPASELAKWDGLLRRYLQR